MSESSFRDQLLHFHVHGFQGLPYERMLVREEGSLRIEKVTFVREVEESRCGDFIRHDRASFGYVEMAFIDEMVHRDDMRVALQQLRSAVDHQEVHTG